MQGVGRARVEACEAQIEVARPLVLTVNQQRADADEVGGGVDPAQCVGDEPSAQTRFLCAFVYSETCEEDDRLIVSSGTLE